MNESLIRTAANSLNVSPSEILYFYPDNSGGINNRTYRFKVGDKGYFFRMPTWTSFRFSDPRNEIALYEALDGRDISDQIIRIDPYTGVKISVAIENARTLDTTNPDGFDAALSVVRALHAVEAPNVKRESIFERTRRFVEIAKSQTVKVGLPILNTLKFLSKFEPFTSDRPCCTVHGDLLPENVLVRPDGTIRLIDFEFAARSDPLEDFASLYLHLPPGPKPADMFLERCLQREPTKHEIFFLFVYANLSALGWQLWAMTKLQNLEFDPYLEDYAQRMSEFVEPVPLPRIPDEFLPKR